MFEELKEETSWGDIVDCHYNECEESTMASKGVEALFQASSDCKFRLVRLLVEGGTPVDTRNSEQQTPIMLACKSDSNNEGKEKVVQFLLKKSAKVNLRDVNGKTALIFACLSNSNGLIISSLMKASASPCIEDSEKNSALDYAISCGNLVTIKLLVDAIQKPYPNFGRAYHEAEMRDLEECFANIQETRKVSWPLMTNLRRFLTYRQRYELISEVPNSNTHRDVISVADKHKSETPHTQRQRKQSICHFEPIDIESILKANNCEDSKSSNISLTESERMASSARTCSEYEKISLHFSEDENDDTSDTPPRATPLRSEELLKRNSSFSWLSSGGSEDMTNGTNADEAKNTTAHGGSPIHSHLVVNATKSSDVYSKSDVASKANLKENHTNSVQQSNINLSTTTSNRRERKNSPAANEGNFGDDWKARPQSIGVGKSSTLECLPKSPGVSPGVSPISSPCMRRKTLSIYNFERNAGQVTDKPNSPSRRYTTSSLPQQRIHSPVTFGSEINFSGLPSSGGLRSEAKSPILRRKISPTRIILKQELDIGNEEKNWSCTPPTAEADWSQTVATRNDEKRASAEQGCETNLPSNFQLPCLSKRPNRVSLDKNVNLQHVEMAQTSNEKDTKTTQAEVLNTIPVARCLPDGARQRSKSWVETPDGAQCFQLAPDVAKQRRRSKCDTISTATTGCNREKMKSAHLKPKSNPLPDLLSHSVSRPSYPAQPPPQVESKNHDENTFTNSCLEPTTKDFSARMSGNCTLPEVVSTARTVKPRQTSILPPLSITIVKKLPE